MAHVKYTRERVIKFLSGTVKLLHSRHIPPIYCGIFQKTKPRVKIYSRSSPRDPRTEYRITFHLSSLAEQETRCEQNSTRIYVTFNSPVLPAGLFGNTFFMNIPDMFCDLLELPLCRSTWNKRFNYTFRRVAEKRGGTISRWAFQGITFSFYRERDTSIKRLTDT